MSTAPTRPPLPLLTTLRFFAAAEVVIFHYALPIPTDFGRGLTSAGYYAVTFFFMLSGFILTYVYSGPTEKSSLNVPDREFWKARFARIAPAYFLGLLLLLPRFIYTALVSKIISIEVFVLGLVLVPLLQQAWWPPVAGAWNTPAWSLSVECFFYALFPMLMRKTTGLSRNYFIVVAYALGVVVTVLKFYFLPDAPPDSAWHNFKWFFPLFHLPLFIFGMALGRLYLFGPIVSSRNHVAMFCIGVVGLILVFGLRSQLPWWTQASPMLVLLFGLVIYGAARGENGLKVLAFPALVLLGEASYSMYILHIPLAFWWDVLMKKALGLSLPAAADFALYFLVVVVGSVLSYLYVEIPLRRRILGHREHRPA